VEVLVEEFGSYLGKKSERLVVRRGKKVVQEIPLFDLEQVLITSRGVSISSDLIRECSARGVPIHFLSSRGEPYAQLFSAQFTGTVRTRREQLLAAMDQRGFTLSKLIVAAKVKNQTNLLKYFGKYRKEKEPELYKNLESNVVDMETVIREIANTRGKIIDDARQTLMSLEARAARSYWKSFAGLVSPREKFPGREHRGAVDPVNSLLNYGYGMLYSQVWRSVVQAGLDPFAGFLHVDRPGKPSMVLDLTEEFRAQMVDRVVLAFIGKGTEIKMEGDRLAEETRRKYAQRVIDRWNDTEKYERKKVTLRQITLMQARHLATFLRGERGYKPFVGGW